MFRSATAAGCDYGRSICPGTLAVDLAVTPMDRDLGGQVSSGELRGLRSFQGAWDPPLPTLRAAAQSRWLSILLLGNRSPYLNTRRAR